MRILAGYLIVVFLISCKSSIQGNYVNQYSHKLKLEKNRYQLTTYDGLTGAELFSNGTIILGEKNEVLLHPDELLPIVDFKVIESTKKPLLVVEDYWSKSKFLILADEQEVNHIKLPIEFPTPNNFSVISISGKSLIDTTLSQNKSYEVKIWTPVDEYQMDTMKLKFVGGRRLINDSYKFRKAN